MLQFFFCFFNFGSNIDKVAQWHCIFVNSYHETAGIIALFCCNINTFKIAHFENDAVVIGHLVLSDSLKHKLFLGGNILLVANGAHTAYNLLDNLNIIDEFYLIC